DRGRPAAVREVADDQQVAELVHAREARAATDFVGAEPDRVWKNQKPCCPSPVVSGRSEPKDSTTHGLVESKGGRPGPAVPVVPHPATPKWVTSLQTLSQSSNAEGVPTVFVNDDASPSSWNCPVSCTARTITTPAPTTSTMDNRIAQRLRQLPVGPTTFLVMP